MTDPYDLGLFSPIEGDRVIVRGSFCEWSGDAYELDGGASDLIYSGTYDIEVNPEDEVEYKYAVLKTNGKVFFETKANAEDLPYGNRKFTMSTNEIILPLGKYVTNPYRLGSIGKDVKFPISELQEDFRMVRQTLEENHCCMYEFTTKEEFDALFDSQYKLINSPMSPNEFFKIITPLTAKVGCGHTNLWMPGDFWDMAPDNLFPLQIKIIENKMVVVGSYRDSIQVPIGAILYAINNRPALEIFEEMKNNYSADGYNPNFQRSSVEQRFPMIFARRFGFPKDYTIQYVLPGHEEVEEVTLYPANNQSVREVVFGTHNDPELSLQLLEDKGVAIMTINTFIYYDRVTYFKNFLDSCFSLIDDKNIKNLILDLRKNDGGDPFCSVPLFSYLAHKPVPYFAEPYGKYSEFAKPIPLAEKRFTGKLYTLLDGRCFSTNGHFSALLKYHGIGKFVGSESGATYSCNAGRNLMIRLVNTRLMLYFGRSSFAVAVKGMDKSQPIKPDYPVHETIQDFLDGRDVVLEKAMELIGESEKK